MRNQIQAVDKITLIGMSGLGKSHWSDAREPGRLPSLGYTPFGCDAEIAKRLEPVLRKRGFGLTTFDVALWMGFPFEAQYEENSELYLKFEQEVMYEALRKLRMVGQHLVDTTGSLYLMDKATLEELQALSFVIMFKAPAGHKVTLYQSFRMERKPVVWGDKFYVLPGERPMQAMERCFFELLDYREAEYAKIAHRQLLYEDVRRPGFKATDLLDLAVA